MTPAPDTGRTAEELKAEIIAALNAAFRGFSFPGGRWSTGYGAEMAADALLSGPLAPILREAATLRARLQEAEKADDFWREVLEGSSARWREAAMMAVSGDMRRLQRLLDAKPIAGSATPVPQTQEAGDA